MKADSFIIDGDGILFIKTDTGERIDLSDIIVPHQIQISETEIPGICRVALEVEAYRT